MNIETVKKNIQELNEFLQDDSLSFDYDKWGSIICHIQTLELKSLSQQQEIERLKGDREKLSELSRFDLVSGDIQSEFDGDYVLLSDVKEIFEPPKALKEDIKDQIEQDKATREALDRYVLKKDRVPKDKFQSEDSTKRFFKPK